MPSNIAEIWKDIPGYEGRYQVSNLGRVKSLKRKMVPADRILRPGKSSNDYLTVVFRDNGRAKTKMVQELVLLAFRGPREAGQYIRHLNDNRLDNRLDNLIYGTPTQNYLDVYTNGNTHGKLHAVDVLCIRRRLRSGENTHTIAEAYGVCERAIRNIREGRTFRWVQ